MRTPYSGSVPVAGRPAFLRLTVIDFAIITYNVKASRGEAVTSALALTQATKDANPMTQADSVHSTPPTNTSAIDDPQSSTFETLKDAEDTLMEQGFKTCSEYLQLDRC